MKLSNNPDHVFHEYEYKIKDGPIIEGRINATIPNSLTDRHHRVFQGEKDITGPDVEVHITKAQIRVFPSRGKKGDTHIDVFVTGTRLGVADHPPILVHELGLRKIVLEQFLAQHPEYQS